MNAILYKTKLISLIALVLLVTACASTQKLSDADRAKYKSAKINDTVVKGPVFLLAPSGANIGLMFGAIGGAATAGAAEDSQKAFTAFLEKNSLSIEKIVREETTNVLRESGKLAIAGPNDNSVPTINISVPQYGFGVTHLLSSNVVPVLQIKCEMLDSTGKVLWSESERMLPTIGSPMEAVAWDQIGNNPKRIEEEWRKASRYLAKKIVDQL